jgi:hypothetical protein
MVIDYMIGAIGPPALRTVAVNGLLSLFNSGRTQIPVE